MNFDLWHFVFDFLGIEERVPFGFLPRKLDMLKYEGKLADHLRMRNLCTSKQGDETTCVMRVTARKAFCVMIKNGEVSHWKQIVRNEFFVTNYSSDFFFD